MKCLAVVPYGFVAARHSVNNNRYQRTMNLTRSSKTKSISHKELITAGLPRNIVQVAYIILRHAMLMALSGQNRCIQKIKSNAMFRHFNISP